MQPSVTKAVPLHAIDLDLHEGTVAGFPAVFGNWDLDGELVEKGAFTKTISERALRVPMGLDHEKPLGVTTRLEEVSRSDLPAALQKAFPDATGGLYAEGRVVQMGHGLDWLEAEKGRIRRGKPSGMSFTARIIQAEATQKGRVFRELALTEWGPTPALVHRNPAAGVLAVKAATPEELAEVAEQLDLPAILDLAGRMAAVKAGRVLSAANLRALDSAIAELRRIRQAATTGTEDGEDMGEADGPAAPATKAAAAPDRTLEARLSLLRLHLQGA